MHNRNIEIIGRHIWFDILNSTSERKHQLLARFTMNNSIFSKDGVNSYKAIQIPDDILNELEKADPGKKNSINYEAIFNSEAKDSQKLPQPNLDHEEGNDKEDEGNTIERNYFFRSRRYFKSKGINERARKREHKRKRSSYLNLYQDDVTINTFNEFEDNLLKGTKQDNFWELFLKSHQLIVQKTHIEQLVKRFCQSYILKTILPLNKPRRSEYKKENRIMLFKLREDINLPEQFFLTTEEYADNRASIQSTLFCAALLKFIMENNNGRLREKLSFNYHITPPYRITDIEIFLDKMNWPDIAKNIHPYIAKFKRLVSKKIIVLSNKKDSLDLSEALFKSNNLQIDYEIIRHNEDIEQLFSSQIDGIHTLSNTQSTSGSFIGSSNLTADTMKAIETNNEDLTKQSSDYLMKIGIEMMLGIVNLSLFLASEVLFTREIRQLISEMDKHQFHLSLDNNFTERKRYLDIHLRYLESSSSMSLCLKQIFKKIYQTDTIFSSSSLYKSIHLDKSINIQNGHFQNLKYVVECSKKACRDLYLGDSLSEIIVKISSQLVSTHSETIFTERTPLELSACIVFVIVKIFYGIGSNFPSVVSISKEQAAKFLTKSQRDKLLSCMSRIDEIASFDKFVEKIRGFSTFEFLVQSWTTLLRNIENYGSSIYKYQELTKISVKEYSSFIKLTLEERTRALFCEQSHNINRSFIEARRIIDNNSNRLLVKKCNEHGLGVGSDILRHEIEEEANFISSAKTPIETLEIPHPSDIFPRYKLQCSMPYEKIGEDYLITLHVFAMYFEINKERLIQAIHKFEKQFLSLI